jgi:hypothetical protein
LREKSFFVDHLSNFLAQPVLTRSAQTFLATEFSAYSQLGNFIKAELTATKLSGKTQLAKPAYFGNNLKVEFLA